ncbi:MAG: DMT family transporter [Rhodobacteraceae bacterium]|nr:DMT family transporter [Paracoccaceae bacterium]
MENLRGAALMTAAMLGFAIEDMFIKLMAGALPLWQIVLCLGLGGATVFGFICRLQKAPLWPRAALSGPVVLRNLGELVGSVGFITALALTPISSASAILQATPLMVTLGAALFLREPVGWRRWSAILAGFFGVMLVIRPGGESFDAMSLFAVQGVIGLAIRDLATRRVPPQTSSMQLSFLAFVTLVPAAGVLALAGGAPPVWPGAGTWAMLGAAIAFGVLSYYAIVAAMRIGEVSFVTPFRYSRIVFALAIGFVVFGERPDMLTWVGAVLIVASGLYTLIREQRLRRRA